MARSPRRNKRKVYWDACAWAAQIWNETVTLRDGTLEHRGALCRAVVDGAVRGDTEIYTSAMVLIEVNKHPDKDPQVAGDKLRDFFENDYIVFVAMDRRVGELGRELMRSGLSGLKPADAAHLASAAVANVDELHTFDTDLLKANGKIKKLDGTILKICKPSLGGPPLPLLESPTEPEDAENGDNTEGADDREPVTENANTAVHESGERIEVSGGRRDVRAGVEADSGGETDPEPRAEETAAEGVTPPAPPHSNTTQPA
jgi:predicted nucleic acid-binding protein